MNFKKAAVFCTIANNCWFYVLQLREQVYVNKEKIKMKV